LAHGTGGEGTHHEPPLANVLSGALEHDQDHDA
jgi:hypothetical protein